MDVSLPGAQEDWAAHRLIEQAAETLNRTHPDIPADFLLQFLASATPEDLLPRDAEALARLTEETWSALSLRRPGAPQIRFAPFAGSAERAGAADECALTVVNDDMPFLFDSVTGALAEAGLEVHFALHPVFAVERDAAGRLVRFARAARGEGATRESVIRIHVEAVDDEARRNAIVASLDAALADVRAAVEDWRPMLRRVGEAIEELEKHPSSLPEDEIDEAAAFLKWLMADNFTFLGVRDYAVAGPERTLVPMTSAGLGLLRGPETTLRDGASVPITPDIHDFLAEPKALIVTKANMRARVHRRVDMDYVGLKRFDVEGRLIGELRIVGLLTSTAYTLSTGLIPFLRRKVDAVLRQAGFDPRGHSGKALVNVLETYPRDELFQIDEDTLYRFALAILQLDVRPRVRVLARHDRFGRFVSVLVYVPRERYDSRIRIAIGDFLAVVFGGRVTGFVPFFPEGPLVRVHYFIGRTGSAMPEVDRARLEQGVAAIVRSWTDDLLESLLHGYEPVKARALFERYRAAFSGGYDEAYSPASAVDDIRLIERLSAERPLGVDIHQRADTEGLAFGLKVWSRGRPIPLSERVPVLENMGFRVVDERTFEITPHGDDAAEVWFHDMLLEPAMEVNIELAAAKPRLEACFLMVMRGLAENDGFNALALAAGLMWRDVALIRAIARYLRQIRIPYSQDYMWATLRKHPGVAGGIVALFHARFDPHAVDERAARESAVAAEIEEALGAVQSLDEDRILRRFVNAVRAAIRTSFYQLDGEGQPKPVIAIKYDSHLIEEMPLPRPLYEIFVYSPQVEGVHLRFGKVARGGIRWSDRPQDFRTEVLGLVKAQQVKNAVIVPVGSKGGFVPKRLPAGGTREAIQAEGVAAYRTFISALLDLTDNLGQDGIVPPADVVRHDGDDPYLVVAADKGTATFSDIANEISQAHGYWLGDAFASGGSAGYDHKKMGITARGAWEAVKRHFRELDIDVGRMPFTVTGIGDMSGDVFGNGMLRERTIELVAAFDHRDILIDPQPDPETSFAERQRLFALPRSSWQDYDKSLISAGGGVFPRSAKAIPLSDEMRALLGVSAETMTPNEVIGAVLRMPVDLLWFGGIGTYVRASDETDEAVGDRANDAVRVPAAALRCKVIGEGANLGATQRGRIEASLRGIKLNSDAIDNSAGVNTSDVEVNIKIALSLPLRDGRLALGERNALLAAMTEDVAAIVLRNNYLQPLALSLAERRGLEDLGFQQRLMQTLERRGELDRAVEFLPDDMTIDERRKRGQPLTRPELAVLLAYAKLSLYADLLDSTVPDDPYLGRELARYFPPPIVTRFPDALEKHRLRREIIATQLANSLINRGGPGLVVRIADQTGASVAGIAAAFAAVRDSYGMTALNGAIDALDNQIPGRLQLDLYAAVQDTLLDRLVWFLRNVDLAQGLASVIAHYRDGIAAVAEALDQVLPADAAKARTARQLELAGAGVGDDLALRLASLPALLAAPDIVLVADRTKRSIADVAATYFAAADYFRLAGIAAAARQIRVTDYFDRLALDRALDAIGAAERRLAGAMVAADGCGPAAVQAWIAPRAEAVERVRTAVHEIAGTGLTLSKLSVAASLLGDLVKG